MKQTCLESRLEDTLAADSRRIAVNSRT